MQSRIRLLVVHGTGPGTTEIATSSCCSMPRPRWLVTPETSNGGTVPGPIAQAASHDTTKYLVSIHGASPKALQVRARVSRLECQMVKRTELESRTLVTRQTWIPFSRSVFHASARRRSVPTAGQMPIAVPVPMNGERRINLTTFRFVSFIVEFDCSGPCSLDPYGRATPVAPDPPESC
jgi:hypothetical protein